MKFSAAFLFASAASVAAARSRLDNHARLSVFIPLDAPCNRHTTVDVVRELGASMSAVGMNDGTTVVLQTSPRASDFPTISIAPLSKEQRIAAAMAAPLDLDGDLRQYRAAQKRDRKNSKRKRT